MRTDFKLYRIKDSYISYLKGYDLHVLDNRKNSSRHTRKYLSIELGKKLMGFIPLCSPHESDYDDGEIKKSCLPIIRMVMKNRDKGIDLLGTLRLSHMIICPKEVVEFYDINREVDICYRELVRKEYRFIVKNQTLIRKNALLLVQQKNNEDEYYTYNRIEIPKYLQMTLDFKFVEEMSKQFTDGKPNNTQPIVVPERLTEEIKDELLASKPIVVPKELPDIQLKEVNTDFAIDERELHHQVETLKTAVINEMANERTIDTEDIEIKSKKAISLTIKSIKLGRVPLDQIIGNCFRIDDKIYSIIDYDKNSMYALLEILNTKEYLLVSDFANYGQCDWDKEIKFGNQEDSFERAKNTFKGFITRF